MGALYWAEVNKVGARLCLFFDFDFAQSFCICHTRESVNVPDFGLDYSWPRSFLRARRSFRMRSRHLFTSELVLFRGLGTSISIMS